MGWFTDTGAASGGGPNDNEVETKDRQELLLPLRKALASTRLNNFLERRPLERRCSRPIVLDSDTSVAELLKVLSDNDVLSVPIVDPQNANYYLGFVSVADVLDQVISEVFPQLLEEGLDSVEAMETKLGYISEAKWEFQQWVKESFLSEPISCLKRGEDGDFVYKGFARTTLLDLVSKALQRPTDEYCRDWGELRPSHRVAVFTVEGEKFEDETVVITDIVSQIDVVEHIVKLGDTALGPIAGRSVEELGLCDGPPVLCVTHDMTAVGAFALMQNMGVSGAAVIDDTGAVTENLSVSDLRCITSAERFDLLTLPVGEFKKAAWPGSAFPDPAVCLRSDALLDVMRQMVSRKIHRVYVVTSEWERTPTEVITLTDILRLFAIEADDESDAWLRRLGSPAAAEPWLPASPEGSEQEFEDADSS